MSTANLIDHLPPPSVPFMPPPRHLVRDARHKLTGLGLKQMFRLRWSIIQRPASMLAVMAGIGIGIGYLSAFMIHRD
jgi:hypothetical protein